MNSTYGYFLILHQTSKPLTIPSTYQTEAVPTHNTRLRNASFNILPSSSQSLYYEPLPRSPCSVRIFTGIIHSAADTFFYEPLSRWSFISLSSMALFRSRRADERLAFFSRYAAFDFQSDCCSAAELV